MTHTPGESQIPVTEVTTVFVVPTEEVVHPEWLSRFTMTQHEIGAMVGAETVTISTAEAAQAEPAQDKLDISVAEIVACKYSHKTSIDNWTQRLRSVGLSNARGILAAGQYGLTNAGFPYDPQLYIISGTEILTGMEAEKSPTPEHVAEFCDDLSQVPALALFSHKLFPKSQRDAFVPTWEEQTVNDLLAHSVERLDAMTLDVLQVLVVAWHQRRGNNLAAEQAKHARDNLRLHITDYSERFVTAKQTK